MIYWAKTDYNGYEVSNYGQIRSTDRWLIRSDTGKLVFYRSRILKTQIDNCGYERVRISINGHKTTLKIHRVVATTFIDNPNNLPQVNHKDGNKVNNHVNNLEWVSNSENQIHAISIGLKEILFSTEATAFTGSVEVYDKNKTLIATLSGNREMKESGLDFRLVSACLHGKRKTHRGFTFKKLTNERKPNV